MYIPVLCYVCSLYFLVISEFPGICLLVRRCFGVCAPHVLNVHCGAPLLLFVLDLRPLTTNTLSLRFCDFGSLQPLVRRCFGLCAPYWIPALKSRNSKILKPRPGGERLKTRGELVLIHKSKQGFILNRQNIPGGGNILPIIFAFETILLNGIGRQSS